MKASRSLIVILICSLQKMSISPIVWIPQEEACNMSRKNLDQKGRVRGKIVSFRVSPEEWEMLNRKVALSGHTKQDYIISSILE